MMMIGAQAVTLQPLATSQPLAHRVLQRIQVRCPLEGVSCDWTGDYGDLQQHLLSPTAHCAAANEMEVRHKEEEEERSRLDVETTKVDLVARNKRRMAQSFKEEANSKFGSGHYREARDLYDKAISILLHEGTEAESRELLATLYSNRAAAHLVLKDFPLAERDASHAIAMDPTYVKAYLRKARAFVQMGKFEEAVSSLQHKSTSRNANTAVLPDSNHPLLGKELGIVTRLRDKMEQGRQQLQANEYASAKATFGRLLQDTSAPNVLLGAARADLGLGLTDSTLRLTLQVLKAHPQSSEGYLVRGHCLVLMTEFESGIKLLKEAMRLDPDSTSMRTVLKTCSHVHALVQQIKDAIFYRQFDQAVQYATTAITQTTTQQCLLLPAKSELFGWLHTERANANLRLKNYARVLQDCALVLYHRQDYVTAWLVRFQALHGTERHEEVLEEVTDLMRQWGANDDRIRKAYEKADFEVRKHKRPDFYKMLGLSPVASEREIKKAYRQTALQMHPDRFVGDEYSTKEREQAKKDFQLLGAGLEILTDDFKRQLYDEGYDLKSIHERVEAAQRAAHQRSGHYHGGHG
jgi:DnaJ family protein C protein 7